MLAGNLVPEGADPLAQVYAGHQFGGWSPQLGDGRALLLGEVIDIATGYGATFSSKAPAPRPIPAMGDGRAWLGPVLREYIVSRGDARAGHPDHPRAGRRRTGEVVRREARAARRGADPRRRQPHPRRHLPVFRRAPRRRRRCSTLADYVIARHYPEADGAAWPAGAR